MNEILLQTIVEKLEATERLLRPDRKNKDGEVLERILEEIKKVSVPLSFDKIDELNLSIDKCCKTLERRSANQIIYKHYLHKGIWIAIILFFVSIFFLWEWMNTVDDKKQFEANDIKYRALKVSRDEELLKLLYQTDSFYNVNADWMRKYVAKEEHLIEQTKIFELAGEKKKSVKDLRNRAEKK
jgi:hypothetical protein